MWTLSRQNTVLQGAHDCSCTSTSISGIAVFAERRSGISSRWILVRNDSWRDSVGHHGLLVSARQQITPARDSRSCFMVLLPKQKPFPCAMTALEVDSISVPVIHLPYVLVDSAPLPLGQDFSYSEVCHFTLFHVYSPDKTNQKLQSPALPYAEMSLTCSNNLRLVSQSNIKAQAIL